MRTDELIPGTPPVVPPSCPTRCSAQEAFDEYVRRQIDSRKRIVELNRAQWAAIHAQQNAGPKWLRWANMPRIAMPIPMPPPLDRDVELRGIQLGLI